MSEFVFIGKTGEWGGESCYRHHQHVSNHELLRVDRDGPHIKEPVTIIRETLTFGCGCLIINEYLAQPISSKFIHR